MKLPPGKGEFNPELAPGAESHWVKIQPAADGERMDWYSDVPVEKQSLYRGIPKVDLHRHLEGSLRLTTLEEIAKRHHLPLPEGGIPARARVQPGDPLTSANFLSKFQTLRQFYCSEEIIDRVTREAVFDAALDGVVHLELRFTPVALCRARAFAPAQVIDWVSRAAAEASRACRISVRLIASVNRHEPLELAERVIDLVAERLDPAADGGLVGLDLAGNEAEFPARPFAELFQEARRHGLRITAHAGEWGGAENVREAIELLGAERIGHGVRAAASPAVMALVRERGVTLEVCLTSNVQSGVVPSLSAHPLPCLLAARVPVTLNTDDPGISGITLSGELYATRATLGLSASDLAACQAAAARASFLPAAQACALEARVAGRGVMIQ